MLITLSPLVDAVPQEIERLLDAAFGADRHTRTAYRLREGMAAIPDLSLAAREDQRLIGSLQCWPIALQSADGATPLILLGPVAILPARQRQGIGRMMMREMLARTRERDPLVLIGDPEYYGLHFGFTADATADWVLPGPFERRRLLALTGGRDLPSHGKLGPRRATSETKTHPLR